MRYRRSCRKCVEFVPEMSKKEVEEDGPPDPCIDCRRFYADNFVLRDDSQ